MAQYIVSSSPHISTSVTTRRMMLDVIIALIPATVASILLYGFYPLFLMVLSVGAAVGAEWLFNLITKRQQSVGDLSAIVTGMILSLNLPAVVPFYVPIVGSAFAIIIVKMLFGGIGKNFANPAITGGPRGSVASMGSGRNGEQSAVFAVRRKRNVSSRF